ncbi:MAG: hypothetical protein PHT12_02330 [Patescibacteria group bacterium]|nr:hypothetical protein [Patescibacteria group bacterium]
MSKEKPASRAKTNDPFQRYLDATARSTKAQLAEGRAKDQLRAFLDEAVASAIAEAGNDSASPYRFDLHSMALFAGNKTVQITLEGLFDKRHNRREQRDFFGCRQSELPWFPQVKATIVSHVPVPEGWKVSVFIGSDYFLD